MAPIELHSKTNRQIEAESDRRSEGRRIIEIIEIIENGPRLIIEIIEIIENGPQDYRNYRNYRKTSPADYNKNYKKYIF